jgi:tetratricopeptide (TPR) repeat protein
MLADLHQELGRWVDSLQVLEQAGELPAALRNLADVLQIDARWNLGEFDAQSESLRYEQLLRIIQARDGAQTRAYLLAARLAKDTGRAETMLSLLRQDLGQANDSVLVRIGRAMLNYHLRQVAESARLAGEAATELISQHRGDTTVVRLLLGLAAIRVAEGDYEGSLVHLRNALRTAVRLDNDTLAGQVHANAAIAYLRLARYKDSIAAGREATRRLAGPRATGYLMQAIEAEGIGSALVGDATGSLKAVRAGDEHATTVTALWRVQDWLLAKADMLWLLGRRRHALDAARAATTGEFACAGDLACIGQHSRWVGRLACDEGAFDHGLKRLLPLVAELDRHDVFDNVEILATVQTLYELRSGYCPNAVIDHLADQTARLSGQTLDHLVSLQVIHRTPQTTLSPQ